MSEKLKRCPFCGNEVKMTSRPIVFSGGERAYHIECQCGITTSEAIDRNSVINYWNRRAEK